jgi:hypothetical protein
VLLAVDRHPAGAGHRRRAPPSARDGLRGGGADRRPVLSQSARGLVGLVAGLLFLAAARTRLFRGPLAWPAIAAGVVGAAVILTRSTTGEVSSTKG